MADDSQVKTNAGSSFSDIALPEIDDFEWEAFSLSHNQAFMDYLEQARQRGKREGTIPIEEVRRRLGISMEK